MSKPRIIDIDKGFRLHFNSLQHSEVLPTFGQRYPANDPRAQSRFYPNDVDLKDRETRTLKNASDLLALMQDKDSQARLKDSVVVFGTEEYPFRQFFVRESEKEKQGRFHTLYNKLAKRRRAEAIPCAMLFEASETKTIRDHGKGQQTIQGQTMTIAGKKVVFELRFDYMPSLRMLPMTIEEGQLILVTGMAERRYTGADFDAICVHVNQEDAALFVTKEELTAAPPQRPYEPFTGVPRGLLPLHGE